MSAGKGLQEDPYLSRYMKLRSKWIKDFNIKSDTLNLIEKKIGNNLEHIGIGQFLNRTLTTQALMSTINEWNLMTLKRFCKGKDTAKRTECEKIFTNPTSDSVDIQNIQRTQ